MNINSMFSQLLSGGNNESKSAASKSQTSALVWSPYSSTAENSISTSSSSSSTSFFSSNLFAPSTSTSSSSSLEMGVGSSNNGSNNNRIKTEPTFAIYPQPPPGFVKKVWRGGPDRPPPTAASLMQQLPIASTSTAANSMINPDNSQNFPTDSSLANLSWNQYCGSEQQQNHQHQQQQQYPPMVDQFALLELQSQLEQKALQQQLLLQLEVPPQVIKEGWIFKRGEHIRNWRQRYFVLFDNGSMMGFKRRPQAGCYEDPLNDFALHDARIMRADLPKANLFLIRGPLQWTSNSDTERAFFVMSPEERDHWFHTIGALIDRLPRLEDFEKLVLPFLENEEQVKGGKNKSDLNFNFGGKKNPLLNPFRRRPKVNKLNSVQLRNRVRARRAAEQGRRAEVAVALAEVVEERRRRNVSFADFAVISQIGKGSFGKVLLAKERRTGKHYALKTLKKTVIIEKDEVAHTLTENRVLQRTKHPFLIELKYSFQTNTLMCFVMEYVNGGELFFHLSRERIFTQRRTLFYACQIVLALEYLHAKGIIYRDLKLENILLDKDGNVKIADFGLCKEHIVFGATTKTFCGTPEYLAPEILEDTDYGRAVDWWGLGVVMFEMLTGRLPFNERDHDALFEKILIAEVVMPPTLSAEASSLLDGLLRKNPHRRLGGGPEDAKEIMYQAFFRGVNWVDVLEKKIKPPFLPMVEDELDLRYFDATFTEEDCELETPPERRRMLQNLRNGNHPDDDDALSLNNSISSENEQPYFTQFSYTASSIASIEENSYPFRE